VKPVIKVWCLPKSSERKLNQLFESIVQTMESFPELGLKGKDSMIVLFPPDMMKFGLGTEIVIEVTNLFLRTVTVDIRDRLAQKLGMRLKKFFPKAMVQCNVYPFDPEQGFWTNPRMGLRRKLDSE